MYDGKVKTMTLKRSIFITLFIPIFVCLLDYGFIKANMVGTFDIVTSMKKSIAFIILIFIINLIEVKISKKFAKS